MKLIIQIVVCIGLSVIFKNLLFSYWAYKEDKNPIHKEIHNSDAWVFGILSGVLIGLLVVDGLFISECG